MKFAINSRVWVPKFESYAIVIGVTSEGHIVVCWYDRDTVEAFKAVVSEDECSTNQPTY